MSDAHALLRDWAKTGATLDQALTELATKDAAREERLRGIEGGLRVELATLSTEIRTERRIGDDERKSLHKRIDGVRAMLFALLRANNVPIPAEALDG